MIFHQRHSLLFVSHSFPPRDAPLTNVGGMQRVSVELHRALAAHPGVRLHSRISESSWRWIYARTLPFLARLKREIPRIVEEEGVETVLFSSMVTAFLAPGLKRRLPAGVRLAAITHGLDVTSVVPFWQRAVPRTLGALDFVFPVSQATAEACAQRGAAPGRVHVVHNGVDASRFPEVADRPAARRQLLRWLGGREGGVGEDALLLASVGRHVERKGFGWFVEHVLPRIPGNAVYLLAGEGPQTPAIRAAAARAGVEGRIRFLGRLTEEELVRVYRGADLFVMPNVPVPGDMEGFGVVTLEAALCGLPVLATALEGIRDAVSEGRTGHLLPPRDPEAFAAAVTRYGDDRAALARLSGRARGAVIDRFSWERTADRYVRHLSGAEPARRAAGERTLARSSHVV